MALLSMRARDKAIRLGLAAAVATAAWTIELSLLSRFSFQESICNLPLTLTILFGFVFSSNIPPITADRLRTMSTGQIFLYQASRGSKTGLLIGAYIAALYSSVLPIYPICYPVIGWASGYFAARHINKETLMCIPLVLLASVAAEFVMAWQLTLYGRPDVFQHLSQMVLPEALLNALIAPFVYFPLCTWHDFLGQDAVPHEI